MGVLVESGVVSCAECDLPTTTRGNCRSLPLGSRSLSLTSLQQHIGVLADAESPRVGTPSQTLISCCAALCPFIITPDPAVDSA